MGQFTDKSPVYEDSCAYHGASGRPCMPVHMYVAHQVICTSGAFGSRSPECWVARIDRSVLCERGTVRLEKPQHYS
jgi:hypothetical protein